MVQIIPAILTATAHDAQRKAQHIAGLVDWVQLDVVDGVFTQPITWNEPDKVQEYIQGVKIEVHLMVQNPEYIIDQWVQSGVQRIYIHYESTQQHADVLQKIKSAGVESGVALLPHTPASVINDIIEYTDAVLVFSGTLGQYGGIFQSEPTLSNIQTLRKTHPQLFIEVDGGVNDTNAKQCTDAGADGLVMGSYIFKSNDIAGVISNIRAII